MSFKIPTFGKVLAKLGPFLLVGGQLSVSASHRFSSPDDFSTFLRTILRRTFYSQSGIFGESFKVSQRATLPTHITIYHDEEDHLLLQYHRGSGHTYCWPRPQGSFTDKFSAPKARNPPNDCPDEIKRQKTKDRMSMLRPLFLSEATRSTHTPIASLAKLVGVKASALRRYRSQVLRGGNFEKNLSFHLRTCVRTILTLDQA